MFSIAASLVLHLIVRAFLNVLVLLEHLIKLLTFRVGIRSNCYTSKTGIFVSYIVSRFYSCQSELFSRYKVSFNKLLLEVLSKPDG